MRAQTYKYIKHIVTTLEDSAHHVVLGDWNAPITRQTHNLELYRTHANTMKSMGLELLTPHGHTYRHGRLDTTTTIDAIYATPTAHSRMSTLQTDMTHGLTTDHALLTCTVDTEAIGLAIPAVTPVEEPLRAAQLNTKITPEVRDRTIQNLQEQLSHDIQYLTSQAHTPLQKRTHLLMNTLEKANQIAMQHCGPKHTGGMRHRPRGVQRLYKRLIHQMQQVQKATSLYHEQATTCQNTLQLITQVKNAMSMCTEHWTDNPIPSTPLELIEYTHAKIDAAKHKLEREYNKLSAQKSRMRYQELWARAKKHAIQQAKTDTGEKTKLVALRDHNDGRVYAHPADITNIIEHYFKLNSTCIGPHITDTSPVTDAPWQRPNAPDRMPRLVTRADHTAKQRGLRYLIADYSIYKDCVKTLSNHKTPGPDNISNELLKMLPEELHREVHALLVDMWDQRYTPDEWKHSETILIHKKHDPLNLSNYRPIALAATLYKLWTRLIHVAAYTYAEQYGILTGAQAGFRQGHSTMTQVELLVMAIEDAQRHGSPIYTAQIDFSNAFNTISQRKLIHIMGELGFPQDLIDNVVSLYHNATTSIRTDHGVTSPIPVGRGTMQGDSLSPFLFDIYMEPLVRWLQQGGRGYEYKATRTDTEPGHTIGSAAYADDLQVLTGTTADLHIQMMKLTAFADWADLRVNHTKSFVTGLHHAEPMHEQQALVRELGTVLVQGQPIRIHHPKDPFTYLGVELTMTLNWTHHKRKILRQLRESARQIRLHPWATPKQKLYMIETCLRTKVTAFMQVVPYRPSDIELVDSILNTAYKHALGLPLSAPLAVTRENPANNGMGCHSIATEYHAINTRAIIDTLNDPSWKGQVATALLALAAKKYRGVEPHLCPQLGEKTLKLRQAASAWATQGLTLARRSTAEQLLPGLSEQMQTLTALMHARPTTRPPDPSVLVWMIDSGIEDYQQLIHVKTGEVMRFTDAKRTYGLKQSDARHYATLTHYLTGNTKAPTDSVGDLARDYRMIHSDRLPYFGITLTPT